VAALAWHTACARPTRCWSVCSADQSARPVAAAGAVPATPAAMSMPDARPVPWNRSSRTADVQQPSGSRTSAGCAGWPNGTPCRASVHDPVGSTRTAVSDSLRTTGSSTWARSMRPARAAGLARKGALRVLRAVRGRRLANRDCCTIKAYPPAGATYLTGRMRSCRGHRSPARLSRRTGLCPFPPSERTVVITRPGRRLRRAAGPAGRARSPRGAAGSPAAGGAHRRSRWPRQRARPGPPARRSRRPGAGPGPRSG